jgi:hypothetical protein
MAKSFTAKSLSRKRFMRKSTRAVEESLLVVLVLDIVGLLRVEWRVGPGAGSDKSGGAELGGAGDNDIESLDSPNIRAAKLKQEPRSQDLC